MTEKRKGNFVEMRARVENTPEKRLPIPIADFKGYQLPQDIHYTASEQIRARENERFGEIVLDGLETLINNDEITNKDLTKQQAYIYKHCNPEQLRIMDKVFDDIHQRLADEKNADNRDVIEMTQQFLLLRYGIEPDDNIKIKRTPLGVVKVYVDDEKKWQEIYLKLGGSKDAGRVGGAVVSARGYTDDARKASHLVNEGNIVYINRSSKSIDWKESERHEMYHWLNHHIFSKYERSRYKNKDVDKVFIEAKDELIAYPIGGSWQSSISALLSSSMFSSDLITRFIKPVEHGEFKERYRQNLIDNDLLPVDTPPIESILKVEKMIEEYSLINKKGRGEIRSLQRQCSLEAQARADKIASDAAAELGTCIYQIARLDVQNSDQFDFALPAIIGAQSFKELAFNLSKVDVRPGAYDVAEEFESILPEDINLRRADHLIVVSCKWSVPVKNMDVLISKLEERVRQINGLSETSAEQEEDKKEIISLLDYYKSKQS